MRNLNIGGEESHVHKEWEIFNIIEAGYVDHVGDARDMSRFEDETFDKVYASHILEHFDFTGDMQNALREWRRILKIGGRLIVAVPNMDRLCELFIDKSIDYQDRVEILRMIYGGHTSEHDYHYVCFDEELLWRTLNEAGFKKIWRLNTIKFFRDTSMGTWKNHRGLSLNMAAERER